MEVMKPPMKLKAALISRFKIMASLNIAERRVPQDGRFRIRVLAKEIDLRISILPTAHGEKIVIRILDPSSARLGIEALGYEPEEKERLLADYLVTLEKAGYAPATRTFAACSTGRGPTF